MPCCLTTLSAKLRYMGWWGNANAFRCAWGILHTFEHTHTHECTQRLSHKLSYNIVLWKECKKVVWSELLVNFITHFLKQLLENFVMYDNSCHNLLVTWWNTLTVIKSFRIDHLIRVQHNRLSLVVKGLKQCIFKFG